ncbi:hypothetical protein [Acidocella sp.]|uniref:hypothetical protein n=1 Tax=Acidocella sp. TaxID=50710 RepID=UPI00262D2EA8|nr:hypothetical protein [Acidocella sp.]
MKRVLGAALAVVGVMLAGSAGAVPLVSQTPCVTVPVSGMESQAQLAQTLGAQGYDHVVLSAVTPSLANPHPELNASETASPGTTPVRDGWNGVAQKDGQTVQVYVTGL